MGHTQGTTIMENTATYRNGKELKCGTRYIWLGVFAACKIIGLVFVIAAFAKGGCDCVGSCVSSCTEINSGCTNCQSCGGGYSANIKCDGLSMGGFFALTTIG